MTTRYDAFDEFDPAVATALRNAIRTGDVSEFTPEWQDALRQAADGDWSAFEPEVARSIRAAVGQEQLAVEAKAERERLAAEANADRALASEMRELTAKYTDFGANAKAILDLAVRGNIGDLDAAYRTWRSSTGHERPALAGQEPESAHPIADLEKRLRDTEARLEKLKLGDLRANDAEIRDLTWKRDDLRDDLALAITKTGNDPDEWRQERIRQANDASARHNAERTTRIARGYQDKSDRMSKEEKRERMDLAAMDVIQGRVSPQELARAHGETIGEPEISTPNAEFALEQITENE